MTSEPVLQVRDLDVDFATSQGEVQAVSRRFVRRPCR